MLDVEKFIAGVHDYITRALSPLSARIKALEDRPAPKDGTSGRDGIDGKDGAPGRDGKDAEVNFAVLAVKAATLIPVPKDGERGEKGERGEQGERGTNGDKGERGEAGERGLDGKDADPAVLAQMVAEGIEKALPAAVQKALENMIPQVAAKAAELVPKPRDGIDGKSVDEAALFARLTDTVTQLVKAIPVPKDGRDGRDGKDATVDVDGIVKQVSALVPPPKDGKDIEPEAVRAMVKEAVAAIPVPRNGIDGKDAPAVDEGAIVGRVLAQITQPKDGRDGKDAEPVDVDSIVAQVVKMIPTPKDGTPGRDGIDGKTFTIEEARGLLESECAKWGLDFERRAQDILQRAIANIPAPKNGVDGKDGISPDSFTASLEGRTLTIGFVRGSEQVTQTLRLPIPLDRGVYRKGMKAEQGDVVTYGGSQWIALKDTDTAPPGDAWRCQVQRGRDGKDSA